MVAQVALHMLRYDSRHFADHGRAALRLSEEDIN
jgi:hypothetical protein